jgi:hypothetical protein
MPLTHSSTNWCKSPYDVKKTGSSQITESGQHGMGVGVFNAAFEEYGLNVYGLDFFFNVVDEALYILSHFP